MDSTETLLNSSFVVIFIKTIFSFHCFSSLCSWKAKKKYIKTVARTRGCSPARVQFIPMRWFEMRLLLMLSLCRLVVNRYQLWINRRHQHQQQQLWKASWKVLSNGVEVQFVLQWLFLFEASTSKVIVLCSNYITASSITWSSALSINVYAVDEHEVSTMLMFRF